MMDELWRKSLWLKRMTKFKWKKIETKNVKNESSNLRPHPGPRRDRPAPARRLPAQAQARHAPALLRGTEGGVKMDKSYDNINNGQINPG